MDIEQSPAAPALSPTIAALNEPDTIPCSPPHSFPLPQNLPSSSFPSPGTSPFPAPLSPLNSCFPSSTPNLPFDSPPPATFPKIAPPLLHLQVISQGAFFQRLQEGFDLSSGFSSLPSIHPIEEASRSSPLPSSPLFPISLSGEAHSPIDRLPSPMPSSPTILAASPLRSTSNTIPSSLPDSPLSLSSSSSEYIDSSSPDSPSTSFSGASSPGQEAIPLRDHLLQISSSPSPLLPLPTLSSLPPMTFPPLSPYIMPSSGISTFPILYSEMIPFASVVVSDKLDTSLPLPSI